jgi:DNA-3-methyladenine glycosylase
VTVARSALAVPAAELAPALLGWTLEHASEEGLVSVELTEVEAYMGQDDPASHAFRGPTERNRVMFGEAGHLYTYLSYGMHWCSNLVTGPEGQASAVLLRAGRVVAGADLARRRRGERVKDVALARGPGCLGQALGLNRDHNGLDLLGDGPVRLRPGSSVPPEQVAVGHRVGVRLAHDVPWRFWVSGDPTVSTYKRSPRVG